MKNKEKYNSLTIKIIPNEFFFEQNTYKKEILKNDLTRREYDSIIEKANLILNQSKIKKKNYEKIRTEKWVFFISFFVIIFFLVYIITLFYWPRRHNGYNLKNIGLTTSVLGLFLLIIIELYNLCYGLKKKKELKEFYYEPLMDFLYNLNKEYNGNIFFEFNFEEKELICYSLKNIFREEEQKKGRNKLPKMKEYEDSSNCYSNNSNGPLNKETNNLTRKILLNKKARPIPK